MNLPFFISKRISKESVGSFSSIINRIAVISISFGLTILIISFIVLFGFKKEIENKIYSFSGHLIVTKYTLSSSFEASPIVVNDSLIQKINANPLIKSVQPYIMKAGLLQAQKKSKNKLGYLERGEIQGIIFKGIDEKFDIQGFKKHLLKGKFPNLSTKPYSTEIILSKKIANYLKLEVGDETIIYFVQNPPRYRKLQITGIYETGLEEFDEKIILGDIDLVRRINNWADTLAGGIEVFIADTDKLEQAEMELFHELDVDLYVDKVTDRYIQIFDWLNLLNRNVVILLVIILFTSGTSIISILLILIMERTQMIGILKSLGAQNRLIRRVFIFNGIKLIVNGLFWGNLIGLGLGFIQFYFRIIPLDSANYYMKYVPIEFDWLTIASLNALVLLLIGLTLLIPVAIISRVKPVRAIRFD